MRIIVDFEIIGQRSTEVYEIRGSEFTKKHEYSDDSPHKIMFLLIKRI